MVLSLVEICAKEVVRDHSSSPHWLRCVPRELYRSLLEAAFNSCRPLAVGELVQRWPDRSLRVGGLRKPGQNPPNRLCIQALLLAVVRGLSDQSSALQVLDLSGLQSEEGTTGDPMGGWSLTVALCTMVHQARAGAQRAQRDRKRVLATQREREVVVKRERGGHGETGTSHEDEEEEEGGEGEEAAAGSPGDGGWVKGVRRRMELQRKSEGAGGPKESEDMAVDGVAMHVRADLFVNARSWERARLALSSPGPVRLLCRYLRVEELTVASAGTLLDLLPRRDLLGLDVRYSSLGVAGLAALLPRLAACPALCSLRLHYCNLDARRDRPDQQEALREMSQGLAQLKALRRLSLTALRLPGCLRTLLGSLAQPLEVLELPYLSLSTADLAYLSCSPHASTLRRLDLSENRLDGHSLPSVGRLLSRASGSLQHLTLSGCGLTDALLGALLPPLRSCRALRSLALALNPLSLAGLVDLVRAAAGMPGLRWLLYPNPLEDYRPGLPELPSSAQLLDWPLDQVVEVQATSGQLHRVLTESCRSDLFLTCDLLNYDKYLLD